MADILSTIKSRRSIRKFQDKAIPQTLIDKLSEALIWAPSAGNLQARKFYFITSQETRNKLLEASTFGQKFIAQAPLVIVGCTDVSRIEKYGERGRNFYAVTDVALSIQNAMLLAHELGLGSCWVGAFEENKAREILKLPESQRPVVLLPLGYPAENPPAPKRVSKTEAIAEIK